MKIEINLTDDMLKLISNIHFGEVPTIEENDNRETIVYGIDFNGLYGGTTFEDVSYILGIYDKHIPGTEENPLGAEFPDDVREYMWNLHTYIVDHIGDIEELVHWFCNKGGLSAGTYECNSFDRIWKRK